MERVDASDVSSENDKNVVKHSACVNWNKHCQLNAAAGSESSLAISGSRESAISVSCVKDGGANREPLNVENVAHSNDTVMKRTRDPNMPVGDTVDKQEDLDTEVGGQRKHRKIIKRFTRLPQFSAASKHNSKPSCFGSNNLPNMRTRADNSIDLNVLHVADVVEQLPNSRGLVSGEASCSSVTELSSAVNLPDNAGNIPPPIPAVDTASAESSCAAVSSVTEAASSEHLTVCDQLSSPRALSQHSPCGKQNRNSCLNPEPECRAARNVCASIDSHSDNQPYAALHSSNKRLSTDVNGSEAKKLQLG